MHLTTDDRRREWNSHQKAAQVTFWLMQGNKLSVSDIARLTGVTWFGAQKMVVLLSAVLPIVEIESRWQLMDSVRKTRI